MQKKDSKDSERKREAREGGWGGGREIRENRGLLTVHILNYQESLGETQPPKLIFGMTSHGCIYNINCQLYLPPPSPA